MYSTKQRKETPIPPIVLHFISNDSITMVFLESVEAWRNSIEVLTVSGKQELVWNHFIFQLDKAMNPI